MLPLDPNTILNRDELAVQLTKSGHPIKSSTLATLACRGGGPDFEIYNRLAEYRWGTSLAWAQRRRRPARTTSSNVEAAA